MSSRLRPPSARKLQIKGIKLSERPPERSELEHLPYEERLREPDWFIPEKGWLQVNEQLLQVPMRSQEGRARLFPQVHCRYEVVVIK